MKFELDEGTTLFEIAISYDEKTYQQLPYIQAPSLEEAKEAVVQFLQEHEIEYTNLEYLSIREVDPTKKILFN